MYRLSGILYILSFFVVFIACKPNIEAPAIEKGQLDVTRYVAVGNSITAGYADNALHYEGQLVSFPNLLATQFKLIGGGEFKQPLVNAASPGIGASLGSKLTLVERADCRGEISLAPTPIAPTGDFSIFALNTYATQGPFNNMGVPGAKVIALPYPGYGNPARGLGQFNPFYTRMASSPANSSILMDVVAQNPTFFTLFIGNNDVLLYALEGATKDSITPSVGPIGVGFDASLDAVVAALVSRGAKGAIANIPDITSLPYFSTVPYNGLVLTTPQQVSTLNSAYAPLGITFKLGQNAFIIEDSTAPGRLRQIAANELVLLNIPQDSIKCRNWGSAVPIPNKYVLTASEIGEIRTAISSYNQKLRSVAAERNLAFVDVAAFLATAQKGITFNGVTIGTTFVTGGAFSLDGVHLSPTGNALLANEFIKSINQKYRSTLPLIDVTKYGGVRFP